MLIAFPRRRESNLTSPFARPRRSPGVDGLDYAGTSSFAHARWIHAWIDEESQEEGQKRSGSGRRTARRSSPPRRTSSKARSASLASALREAPRHQIVMNVVTVSYEWAPARPERRAMSERPSASGSRTPKDAMAGRCGQALVKSIANQPARIPALGCLHHPEDARSRLPGEAQIEDEEAGDRATKIAPASPGSSRPLAHSAAAYQAKATSDRPARPSSPSIMLTELTTPTMAKMVTGATSHARPTVRHPRDLPAAQLHPAPQSMIAEAAIWIPNFMRGDISATSSQQPMAITIERLRIKYPRPALVPLPCRPTSYPPPEDR